MNPRLALVALSAAGGLVLAGCIAASDPAAAPAPQGAPAKAQAGPARYEIDPVHTTITFRIQHMGVSYFYGRFNQPAGSFVFDPEKPSSASFEINVKADNVDTDSEARDKHLKSPDFFNARQFPEITFKSTSVQRVGTKTMKVSGDLSLHGITRPVTVDLEHVGIATGRSGNPICGFDGKLTLDRSVFDMKTMIGPLGTEVTLMIGIEGERR